MEWIQVIVLSLIQGVTEFLPISSSAHLVLPGTMTQWPDQGLGFDVAVHFGTLIAVIAYFRTDLLAFFAAIGNSPELLRAGALTKTSAGNTLTIDTNLQRQAEDLLLLVKLGLATIPVVIGGLLAKDFIAAELRTIPIIATTTLLFAGALWASDRRPGTGTHIGWSAAAMIGLAQMLALIPGTSRSGVTITAALFLGLSRVTAARFSFLLAIPTIAGAQLLLTWDLLTGSEVADVWHMTGGAVLAGISAYAGIHFFIQLVERTGMLPYVIYRLALGAVLLIWFV